MPSKSHSLQEYKKIRASLRYPPASQEITLKTLDKK